MSGKAILEDAQKSSDSVKLVAQQRHPDPIPRKDRRSKFTLVVPHEQAKISKASKVHKRPCFARRGVPTERLPSVADFSQVALGTMKSNFWKALDV